MITLTTPVPVNSVLGSSTTVSYDRFVISPFTFDPKTAMVNGVVRISSTANPDMQAVAGTLSINLTTGILEIAVPQLDFQRRVTLTGPQITGVQNTVNTAQNSLENGMISVGTVAGTQSSGV